MSDHTLDRAPETANLGTCKEVLIDGFDGDDRAVLVLQLKKPIFIEGHRRKFAGIVLEQAQLEQLARGIMHIAKRKRRQFHLVRPVRFV